MLIGHLAISTLLHRYLKVDLAPVMVGGMAPDLIDKTLSLGLQVTPSGRMFAHTLLSWGVSTLGVALLWGRGAAVSWSAGYLGHLLADSDGFVPWFFPFRSYYFERKEFHGFRTLKEIIADMSWLERLLVIWALGSILWNGRGMSERGIADDHPKT